MARETIENVNGETIGYVGEEYEPDTSPRPQPFDTLPSPRSEYERRARLDDPFPPAIRSSLRPPRMPSDVAPYSVPVPALWAAWLYAFAACGVIAALYLGIVFEVHYQIGGFLGLAWLVSVAFAGAIVGATLLLVWEMRRGE